MKIKALSLFAIALLVQEAWPVNIYNEAHNRVRNKVKHRHGHHGSNGIFNNVFLLTEDDDHDDHDAP